MLRLGESSFAEETATTRLRADQVMSMAMLHNAASPTLAVLCQNRDKREVKIFLTNVS